ncbi:hypothetical protein [Ralstonia condita]|uniref:hypothetical protein n=1 Tax=Ralstonia condita TaxID=3058600 RepID=UPI00292DD081|nr:hypothetical protein [Ralstonia sp. LMG 7141]
MQERAGSVQGRIKIPPELRVVGSTPTFALGDMSGLDENKMAWHIASQVETAADNISKVLAGFDRLRAYQPQAGNPMLAVTLGSRAGVLHLPVVDVVRSAFVNRLATAGQMLVPTFRKMFDVRRTSRSFFSKNFLVSSSAGMALALWTAGVFSSGSDRDSASVGCCAIYPR